MTICVLGCMGSIGKRHLENLKSLGIDAIGYDLASNQTRESVIRESDAVVIATPTNHHLNDLNDCINAGKHALVEKPIWHSTEASFSALDDPDQILKRAKEKNLVVFIGNNLRYHACVRAAKEKLLMGAIGNPLWASITVGQFTDKEPYLRDGVTLNWGAHEIDLALHLLGPAKVLAATTRLTARADPGDDVSDFILSHDSGCRSSVHLDYVTKPEIRATTIVGDKGQLTIDLVRRWGCITQLDGQQSTFQANDSWDSNYVDEMKGFLARINGHNDGIGATGEDGLETLKIIEAVKNEAKKQENHQARNTGAGQQADLAVQYRQRINEPDQSSREHNPGFIPPFIA